MNYKIDEHSSLPAYLQLYYGIRKDIIDGVYPYMTKLPSKRTIAADTQLSLITVEHTLELLVDEGYVESRQRSGNYCIYKERDFRGTPSEYNVKIDIFNATDEQSKDFIPEYDDKSDGRKTDSSDNKIDDGNKSIKFPYSTLSKVMRKVLSDYGERILVKSPNSGCEELKEQIRLYLSRSTGIVVDKEQIIIGAGAEYLYGLVAQMVGTDSLVAIEDPSYEKIRKVYEAEGIKCEGIALTKSGLKYDDLEASNAKVLHVTPFNSFPSGISVGITKKKEYLHWAKVQKGLIIEDNYDSEFTVSSKMEDTLFSMATEGNVIYLNTFSKTIAPSLRVGYMILPKELVDLYEEKLGFYSCPVPLFEQFVIAELIRNGDFERHINRVRRSRRKDI